jgi:hypothetical protein
MQADAHQARLTRSFELCIPPLFDARRGFAFPCDQHGAVDLDTLSERARNNYFYARATVGRDFASPRVQPLQ